MKFEIGKIALGDCSDWFDAAPPGIADLIFADPPFNIGLGYTHSRDDLTPGEYSVGTRKWMTRAMRVLRPGGALWIAIGDEMAARIAVAGEIEGFDRRNWIVWNYGFGVHLDSKFGRSKVHMLYLVKPGGPITFNPDAVREPSERQTKYGDKRANPKGRVPSDVWKFPRVCGTFKERTPHPCQMPEAVLSRVLRACSKPGDLILDPMCGSGTTLAVAKKLGRRWSGCDLSPDYRKIALDRLRAIPGNPALNPAEK